MFGNDAVSIYDRCPSPKFEQVLKFIRYRSPRAGKLFDVGCGTGSLIALLNQRGWRCAGCDPSAAMVRAARTKNPTAAISNASASNFQVESPVDLVTCTFDVVNHFPSLRVVSTFFRRARAALRPSGLLIFDTVTPADINVNWIGYIEVDRVGDTYMVRTGRRTGDGRGTLTYEIFRRVRGDNWRKSVEVHTLRALDREWMLASLRASGFVNIQVVDAMTLGRATPRTVRWLIAARVPNAAASGSATNRVRPSENGSTRRLAVQAT